MEKKEINATMQEVQAAEKQRQLRMQWLKKQNAYLAEEVRFRELNKAMYDDEAFVQQIIFNTIGSIAKVLEWTEEFKQEVVDKLFPKPVEETKDLGDAKEEAPIVSMDGEKID